MKFLSGSTYRQNWDVYNLASVFRAVTNVADDAQGVLHLSSPCKDAGRFSSFFSDLITKCCGDTIELGRDDALAVIDSGSRFYFVDHNDGAGHRVVITVHDFLCFHQLN